LLYVEGARDREILRRWAHSMSSDLARTIERSAVILGGRQPGRAVEHFARAALADGQLRAVCVLDRDDVPESRESEFDGLTIYTWQRRHIESYLLAPEAICRVIRAPGDGRVDRFFRDHVPNLEDEPALRNLDAKRLLSERGPLARSLGRAVGPGEIARAMRMAELHRDVVALLEQIRIAAGGRPEVSVLGRVRE
jgi:hypothetical protein